MSSRFHDLDDGPAGPFAADAAPGFEAGALGARHPRPGRGGAGAASGASRLRARQHFRPAPLRAPRWLQRVWGWF
ncbi:MAG: hypothetical protein JNJ71_10780 [Rubrivivax sp.]|nr:hypothetical protein [Rubrivivax sp.]